MKFLTPADESLIAWAESLGRREGKLPIDLDRILDIIHRQNLALEKAIELLRDTHKVAAEYYETSWGSADEVEFQMNKAKAEITAIMNGDVKNV